MQKDMNNPTCFNFLCSLMATFPKSLPRKSLPSLARPVSHPILVLHWLSASPCHQKHSKPISWSPWVYPEKIRKIVFFKVFSPNFYFLICHLPKWQESFQIFSEISVVNVNPWAQSKALQVLVPHHHTLDMSQYAGQEKGCPFSPSASSYQTGMSHARLTMWADASARCVRAGALSDTGSPNCLSSNQLLSLCFLDLLGGWLWWMGAPWNSHSHLKSTAKSPVGLSLVKWGRLGFWSSKLSCLEGGGAI